MLAWVPCCAAEHGHNVLTHVLLHVVASQVQLLHPFLEHRVCGIQTIFAPADKPAKSAGLHVVESDQRLCWKVWSVAEGRERAAPQAMVCARPCSGLRKRATDLSSPEGRVRAAPSHRVCQTLRHPFCFSHTQQPSTGLLPGKGCVLAKGFISTTPL